MFILFMITKKNEDLYYETKFEIDLKDEDSCYDAWEFIDENIDTDELFKRKGNPRIKEDIEIR